MEEVVEPKPSEKMFREIPGMTDERRRPMILLIRTEKMTDST